MFLAQEYDAVDEAGPFLSPARERMVSPDLHSRLVGYLATAPEAAPGFRTDGVWVWPQALVEHLRRCGAVPQRQFFEHVRQQWFLLPAAVPADVLAEAARIAEGPPTPEEHRETTYYIGEPTRPDQTRTLLRRQRQRDGREQEHSYFRDGWDRSDFLQPAAAIPDSVRRTHHEVGVREAAEFNDQLWLRVHASAIKAWRETLPRDGVRVAATYDGVSPAGTPWFSPGRLRLPEPVRRERLAAYLLGGRLVLRAAGHMVDPLEPELGPVVPLSFRTDGVWVWQDALAYYLRRRGVAPELELLGHIEERGYRPPDDVPAELISEAAAIVLKGPVPVVDHAPVSYYAAKGGGYFHRARGGHPANAELFGQDKRWAVSDLLWRQEYGGSDDYAIEAISEEDAVRHVDDSWIRGGAVPPWC